MCVRGQNNKRSNKLVYVRVERSVGFTIAWSSIVCVSVCSCSYYFNRQYRWTVSDDRWLPGKKEYAVKFVKRLLLSGVLNIIASCNACIRNFLRHLFYKMWQWISVCIIDYCLKSRRTVPVTSTSMKYEAMANMAVYFGKWICLYFYTVEIYLYISTF